VFKSQILEGRGSPEGIGADVVLTASELLFLLGGFQNLEGAQQTLVYTHHGASIVKLSAVVGSAEECDQLPLGKELVAVLDDLVGTADQVHVVLLQEPGYNVGPKGERDTTVVLAPAGNVLVGVRPEKIAQESAVGDLQACQSVSGRANGWRAGQTYVGGTHDAADLLHRVQVRAETAVHGENLLIDDGSNGQAVEAVGKRLPQLNVVSALALVIEAIDSVDGSTLVVATEDEEVLGVLDLVCQQQADGLEGLLATVDVVAEEEVVGLGGEAAVLEESQQVVVLAVDVAADLDGSFELEQNGLRNEDFTGLGAEVADLRLEELDLLAGAAASDLEQPIDYRVEIDLVLVCHCRGLSRREVGRECVRRVGGGPTRAVGGARCGDCGGQLGAKE
jgi:hypothetical protein